jgi:hypothetical protein
VGTKEQHHDEPVLKPMDIKRQARVPYRTVIDWIEHGHPRAGLLPSINLAPAAGRRSYRIRPADWEAFLVRLQTLPAEPRPSAPEQPPRTKQPRPGTGVFRY